MAERRLTVQRHLTITASDETCGACAMLGREDNDCDLFNKLLAVRVGWPLRLPECLAAEQRALASTDTAGKGTE